jgi:hypothetical protein
MLHDSILAQIKSLGYAVSTHCMGEYIEMHAVELARSENQHIARVVGSDVPDASLSMYGSFSIVTKTKATLSLFVIRL